MLPVSLSTLCSNRNGVSENDKFSPVIRHSKTIDLVEPVQGAAHASPHTPHTYTTTPESEHPYQEQPSHLSISIHQSGAYPKFYLLKDDLPLISSTIPNTSYLNQYYTAPRQVKAVDGVSRRVYGGRGKWQNALEAPPYLASRCVMPLWLLSGPLAGPPRRWPRPRASDDCGTSMMKLMKGGNESCEEDT
jgi:hypothetical protein